MTLNHLDSIRKLTSSSEKHVGLVNSAARMIADVSVCLGIPLQSLKMDIKMGMGGRSSLTS